MKTEYNLALTKYNTNISGISLGTSQKFDPLGRSWNISSEPNGQINVNVLLVLLILTGICILILFSVNPK